MDHANAIIPSRIIALLEEYPATSDELADWMDEPKGIILVHLIRLRQHGQIVSRDGLWRTPTVAE